MKKFFLLLIVIASITNRSYPQQSKIDSFLTLLKKDKEDTDKVNHLNILARKLSTSNPDTSILLANKALSLAEKVKSKKHIANSYHQIAWANLAKDNFPSALENNFKALKLREELGDKIGIALSLNNIGLIYRNQNDYSKALDCYLRALKTFEELGDKNKSATVLGNIGGIYNEQRDYAKALDYYFRSLKISEELGNKNLFTMVLGNIGNAYNLQGDYSKALDYNLKAMKLAEELEDQYVIAGLLCNIGFVYTNQKKYIKALEYLNKSLQLSKNIGGKNFIKLNYLYLTKLDSAQKNWKLAYEHHKLFMLYRDSLINEENTKKTVQTQMQYEFDKKESLTKAGQDKKDAIVEEEKRRQKVITYSVSGGLFLVLLLALFIFRGYKQKKKANKELAEKNLIIEEHNKDITDSLHYASRIQRALLTSKEYISTHLNEYFILFKPKDIVSGDFYWAFSPMESSGKHNFFFACCDCTGHGVPGAFMSLLNISFLNEALIAKDLREPNEILNNVRANIVKALNPDGSTEKKDGMDAVLCAIDLKRKMLYATCANNPIWIARNGIIDEIAPDKMPVGSHINMDKSFTKHSVQLQQGDIVYLFTDGYADQFGGPKGKKFKYKQLNEQLLAINDKPLAEQKTILEKTFEDWKGNLEQVDDVLVIGIRL